MTQYSKILLRFSALFALFGTFLGAHMAGAGSHAFVPIHAHILVVGWLSLFAWAVYYKIFYKQVSALATTHVWTAVIGTFGLTAGMWMHFSPDVQLPDTFTLIFYIVGGTILLISFFIFFILTFTRQGS